MKKSLHDYRLMDCLYLTTYINLICGTMTKIHRKEKYVRITDNSFTPYDYLFLMCGEQFLRPSKIRDDEPIPKNVFVINTNIDITKSLLDLNRLMKHSEGNKSNSNFINNSFQFFREYNCLWTLFTFIHNAGIISGPWN